jgi:hypothetical protein
MAVRTTDADHRGLAPQLGGRGRNALERANRTLRNITGIEVLKENAAVEDGRVAEYRATCS